MKYKQRPPQSDLTARYWTASHCLVVVVWFCSSEHSGLQLRWKTCVYDWI